MIEEKKKDGELVNCEEKRNKLLSERLQLLPWVLCKPRLNLHVIYFRTNLKRCTAKNMYFQLGD